MPAPSATVTVEPVVKNKLVYLPMAPAKPGQPARARLMYLFAQAKLVGKRSFNDQSFGAQPRFFPKLKGNVRLTEDCGSTKSSPGGKAGKPRVSHCPEGAHWHRRESDNPGPQHYSRTQRSDPLLRD